MSGPQLREKPLVSAASGGRPKGPISPDTDQVTRAVIEAIDATGFTDGYVCQRARIGRNELSRMRGGQGNPTVKTLARILAAVGMTFVVLDNQRLKPRRML